MSKDILKRVRGIELRTRKKMTDVLSGRYKSHFRGQGIQFSEHRVYTPGDDIRHLDWKVSARSKEPLIRQYDEERELNVLLLVDVSASMRFGSQDLEKFDVLLDSVSLLSHAAVLSGDKVGAILFADSICKRIPLKKGRSHPLRILHELTSQELRLQKGTAFEDALREAQATLKHTGIVFILSDFRNVDGVHEIKKLAKKHDVVLIEISDPAEQQLPKGIRFNLLDPESGSVGSLLMNWFSDRHQFEATQTAHQDHLKLLQNIGRAESIQLNTLQNPIDQLVTFLTQRKQKIR